MALRLRCEHEFGALGAVSGDYCIHCGTRLREMRLEEAALAVLQHADLEGKFVTTDSAAILTLQAILVERGYDPAVEPSDD